MTQPNAKLVEVARAICTANGVDPDTDAMGAEPGSEDYSPEWLYYVEDARAAIRALMEPSEDMEEAGWDAEDGGITLLEHRHHASIVLRAMLAKVLEEEG